MTIADKLAAKRHELTCLQELQVQSKSLVDELEVLASKMSSMASGAEAVAELMANWGQVLEALKLSQSSLVSYVEGHEPEIRDPQDDAKPPLPEKLIRIRSD